MGKNVVKMDKFTKAIGNYSPAVETQISDECKMLFISGQVAGDQDGNVIGIDDPERQTREVFSNLEKVLKASGGDLSDLVSITIYIQDMKHFDFISNVRNEVFRDYAPSSTLVEVKGLAVQEHLVEISGIAMIQKD